MRGSTGHRLGNAAAKNSAETGSVVRLLPLARAELTLPGRNKSAPATSSDIPVARAIAGNEAIGGMGLIAPDCRPKRCCAAS